MRERAIEEEIRKMIATAPTQSIARARHAARVMLCGLLALAMAGCSSLSGGGEAPAQREPTRLEISISADRDLNTDTKGRGAPMLLRVYELKSDVAFQEADFFGIQNSAKAVLGADLLAVDQFIIRPGESREIKRKSNPETTAIGIFAGYRDLPNAVWRVVHKVPPAPENSWMRSVIPSNKVALKIDLQSNAIVLTDQLVGTRPVEHANESMTGLEQQPADEVKAPAASAPARASDAAPKAQPRAAEPASAPNPIKPTQAVDAVSAADAAKAVQPPAEGGVLQGAMDSIKRILAGQQQ